MTLVFSCLTQMILVHKLALVKAVFRIHDILVWIRIRGSMPLTNGSGSGSGRPKNMVIRWIRIRIRIRKAQKHGDPVDPNPDSDPEYWVKEFLCSRPFFASL